MTKILLVEDDKSLSETIAEQLEDEHFSVSPAFSVEEAKSQLKAEPFELAIVDVNLPDGDGFELVRDYGLGIPAIFLTAMNSAEYRLEAYEIGAADFIPKPFHFKELLLRLKKVMKEAGIQEEICFPDFSILPLERKVLLKSGRENPLTENDFRLLQLLLRESPRPVSRQEILDSAWAKEGKANARSIDNAVVRLREALGENGKDFISSVRGVGYCWRPRV